MPTNSDPTRSLDERTPDEIGDFADDHLLMALDAASRLAADRQSAEDYMRDRIVALSDTFTTHDQVVAECRRRTTARVLASLSQVFDQ